MIQRFGDDYLARLQRGIERSFKCEAHWLCSEPVDDLFRGPAICEGKVELFELTSHPKAKKAYAWAEHAGPYSNRIRHVVVLETPPVVSAETAVWRWIVSKPNEDQDD